jgi:MFS transporter, DHA1 family, tetracycline resistance protein
MNTKKNQTLFALFLTLLLDMIGIGMIIPIIPIIFTDPSSPNFLLTGYSQAEQYIVSGAITAIFGIMQFIGAPILGELSDVYGRKRLLIIGVGGLAFSQMLFGFGIETASLSLIFASRFLAGLSGANFSIVQAAIVDISEPHERVKNFGLIGAAFGIGFIFGPTLGGWIARAAQNPAAPFWFAGLIGIANLMLITYFLKETHHDRTTEHHFHILKGIRNIRTAFRDADARPLYLSSFLYSSGFTFFTSFIGIFLVNRFSFDEASIGTFFGIIGAWSIFTQIFILRVLSKKYSERAILRWSFLSVALAIALYPFIPEASLLFAVMPFFSVPQGLSMANLGSLISKGVSKKRQGAALGINGSLMALSQGIIPLLAGFGSGFFGLRIPFLIGSLFVLAAWINLFVLNKKKTV